MSAATRRPYLGEDVHYVAYGTPGGEFPQVCRAAKVTEVIDSAFAHIMVFNPTGIFIQKDCPYVAHDFESLQGGSWHFGH